jgi:hypothetical protein
MSSRILESIDGFARRHGETRSGFLMRAAIETMARSAQPNKHLGSSFEDFLAENGQLHSADRVAKKRVAEWRKKQAAPQRKRIKRSGT